MATYSKYGLNTDLRSGYDRMWCTCQELHIEDRVASIRCWFDGSTLNPTSKTWTCRLSGGVAILAGSGDEPDFEGHSAFAQDRVCNFKQAKYIESPNNILGDVALEDIVLIYGINSVEAGSTRVFGKLRDTPDFQGWQLTQIAGSYYFKIYSGGTTVQIASSAAILDGHNIGVVTINRDEASTNGSRHYVAGVGGGGVNCSSIGTMTCAVPLQIGAALSGSPYAGGVSLMALFTGTDFFSAGAAGKDEMDAIAKMITARYLGIEAAHAHTSGPALVPVSF